MKLEAPALRAPQGILMVYWRSWITVGDVIGAALVVLTLASKYYMSSDVLIVERVIN